MMGEPLLTTTGIGRKNMLAGYPNQVPHGIAPTLGEDVEFKPTHRSPWAYHPDCTESSPA